MSGPFHYHLRRDAGEQGKADEGAAASMGADEFVFWLCSFLSFSSPIGNSGNRRVEFAEFAEILKVVILFAPPDPLAPQSW